LSGAKSQTTNDLVHAVKVQLVAAVFVDFP